jgi:hypothetical protein
MPRTGNGYGADAGMDKAIRQETRISEGEANLDLDDYGIANTALQTPEPNYEKMRMGKNI